MGVIAGRAIEADGRGRRGRLVAALVVTGALLAVGLSPAGAKFGELIDEAFDGGASDPRPALTSLPAARPTAGGSEAGVRTVAQDGSQRQFDPGAADAAELPQIEDRCCSAATGGDR